MSLFDRYDSLPRAATETRHGAGAGPAPERPRLLRQLGIAALAATAVTVLFVLPAEYGIDPTGVGGATGLTRISEPQELVVTPVSDVPFEIARSHAVPYREDTIMVRVGGLDEFYGQVEYKLTMQAGDTLLYSWSSPEELYYEFHGHDDPNAHDPGAGPMEVMEYENGRATEASGVLTAPIDGIHGWFLANRKMEPVMMELHLAGWYELGPGLIALSRQE
ncbi:hypothetical protein [Pseudoroseicyclus tamaricis]|uniref:Uncharacterized protein n=1 Tax=Pseudoroseicyclus tamaricis TaxID=2705421 RepID=A0A6B2JMI9_9RHOB|nr:hypothetical protein [Pseudoroseicyclus tamaricis]NDV02811.1 hypothetical protein [Pseudoroseicyclus tamaricis]